MALHRTNTNITELKTYFNTVIDWVSGVFTDVETEMRGLEWGQLYEVYHATAYNPSKISEQVHKLYGDSYIKNRKGILNISLVTLQILNFSKFGYLMRQQKNRYIPCKQIEQKRKISQIVLIVLSDTMQIRVKSGI